MYLTVALKSCHRGGSLTPFYASLLAGVIVVLVACQTVLAQPAPAKPSDRPKAPGAAPAPAAPAAPAEAAPKPEPKYDEDPTEETPAMKKLRVEVLKILKGGRVSGGDQDVLDQYYRKFALPRWTQGKYIPKITDFRKDLRSELSVAKGQAHDYLNALTLEYINKLLAGRYHPGVQVNAMLMIGDLNAEEQGPVPLPAALEVLIAAVGNEKLSDGLRAAAMVGILRDATLGIEDAETRRSVMAAMLKLVAAADPPGNPATVAPTPSRQWICRRAIDTLGRFGAVGENNAVFNAILKTVADAKLSLYTRSTAAESLGRLNYTGVTGINAVEAAATLGQFVIDACNDELQRVKAKPDIDLSLLRRWIRQHLLAASTALTGADESHKGILTQLKEGEQRAFGDALQKAVKEKSDLLDDPKTPDDDLTPQVEELKKTLDSWLQKKPK